MCGIVGLYLKNPELQTCSGELFAPMLIAMSDRGPDSAGFAIYRDEVESGRIKLTLQSDEAEFDWKTLADELAVHLECESDLNVNRDAAVIKVQARESQARTFLSKNHPEVNVRSVGRSIEILKSVGMPAEIAARYRLSDMSGTHLIGHTRMATESAVTTAGSHPFSTGMDFCLVHNGSLSNHNWLRAKLMRRGISFETENDTEVAAGYLTWRLSEGDSLTEALEHALEDLDGFYTLTIGTRDGFAVLRDPIACKPAVLAETEDYVAMASEYQALAHLPAIEQARLWEPEPATVYVWGGETAV